MLRLAGVLLCTWPCNYRPSPEWVRSTSDSLGGTGLARSPHATPLLAAARPSPSARTPLVGRLALSAVPLPRRHP